MKLINRIFRYLYPAKTTQQIMAEFNIPNKIRFKFESTKDGWIIATSEDLPGFITEAKNPHELFSTFNDGILTYFDVPKRAGDFVHDKLTIDGHGTVSVQVPRAA